MGVFGHNLGGLPPAPANQICIGSPCAGGEGPARSLTFAFWPLPESKPKGRCGGRASGVR